MDHQFTLYEERRALLRRGAVRAYREVVHARLWPALMQVEAHPLALLTGLIGTPIEETYLFTGFADAAAWRRAQPIITGVDPDGGAETEFARERGELIKHESVRLLLPSGERPKPVTPLADRRPVYGMRRFTIAPTDWPAFVQHSATGIWPRIEAQGACILGLFRDAATTQPLEATLLTGYHGPAHWEATRDGGSAMAAVSPELREANTRGRSGRSAMTLTSYVRLMSAQWAE